MAKVNLDKYSYYNLKSEDKIMVETIDIPNVNNGSYIRDSRRLSDFKTQTFGGYAKNQISSAMDKAIMEGKIEASVQYGIQLLFSGCTNILFDRLVIFTGKNINIGNPLLPEYLHNRMLKWHKITDSSKFTKDNVLLLRNHPEVRNILVEFIIILCLSKKKKLESSKKIKETEYIFENFKKHLEAPNTNFIDKIAKKGDPSEMKIAINELGYQIYKGDIAKCYYWINWLLEWDKRNTKKYGKYECATRIIKGVDSKYHSNVIWLIWDMVLLVKKIKAKNYGLDYNNQMDKQIGALWNMFIYKYSTAQRNKKLCLLIWAINYIINFVDWKVQLIDRPHILMQSMLNIDKLIRNLKVQAVNRGLAMNSDVMNIVVQNNFMVPQNHNKYTEAQYKKEQAKKQKELEKFRKSQEQEAKKKKIDIITLQKLKALNNIDSQIF